MGLDAFISEWTEDRVRSANDVLTRTIHSYQAVYGRNFPPTSILLGDNWIYIADIEQYNSGRKVNVEGADMDLSMAVLIHPREINRSRDYIALPDILEHFKDYLPSDTFALMPYSERRKAESELLGPVISKTDTWQDVQYDGKTVKIFKIPSEVPSLWPRGRLTFKKLRKLVKSIS